VLAVQPQRAVRCWFGPATLLGAAGLLRLRAGAVAEALPVIPVGTRTVAELFSAIAIGARTVAELLTAVLLGPSPKILTLGAWTSLVGIALSRTGSAVVLAALTVGAAALAMSATRVAAAGLASAALRPVAGACGGAALRSVLSARPAAGAGRPWTVATRAA
jgi:hypothetical protein